MTHTLLSPIDGQLIPVKSIPDPVFADEMMGPAFAIEPSHNAGKIIVHSPLNGVVKHIAKTGHSVIIGTDDGADVMLHLGVDTVHLKGEGFQTRVTAMQHVSAGDPLIDYDVAFARQKTPSAAVIVILINPEQFAWQLPSETGQGVQANTPLLITLQAKGDE